MSAEDAWATVDALTGSAPVLDESQVLEFLRANEAPDIPMRFQPQDDQDHPGDKVFPMGVPLGNGRYLLLTFSFGEDSEDAMEAWKPVWHTMAGPMSLEEIQDAGRAMR